MGIYLCTTDISVYDRKDLSLEDTETSSMIHMTGKRESKTPDRALYLREINKLSPQIGTNSRCLALILIMPKETLLDHGLLEYNVQRFKDAILSIFGLQGQ